MLSVERLADEVGLRSGAFLILRSGAPIPWRELQWIIRSDKLPRQIERFAQLSRESLHRMNLCRIVAAKVEVKALFLGAVEVVLAQFARHQRIHPGSGEGADRAVAAAAAKSDFARRVRPALDGDHPRIERLQFRAQRAAGRGIRRD